MTTVHRAEVEDSAPKPSGRPQRRRNQAQSRERLLKAASSEFALHGFAGARIDRIVRKAGSNPRMLYHYFGGKNKRVFILDKGYENMHCTSKPLTRIIHAFGDLLNQIYSLETVRNISPVLAEQYQEVLICCDIWSKTVLLCCSLGLQV